jgi:phosphotransferase system HPr (HPr) family protein
MVHRDCVLKNQRGLHARSAAHFVKTASAFKSDIWIMYQDQKVSGKSIMALMMLGARVGKTLSIYAQGDDEEEAIDTLAKLIHEKFYEN